MGALNVDIIAARPGVDGPRVDDRETPTTVAEVEAFLRTGQRAEAFLGGSAFNAMVMLAQLRTDLRLGMVGISAPAGWGAQEAHTDRLRALRVVDLTRRSDRPPGACLAVSGPHGRRLRTTPAANLEIADYLADDDGLRRAVSSARILHLSSLLEEPEDPGSDRVSSAVADFVDAVKDANPALILSFDPGQTWVDTIDRLPALRRIYARADVVYANAQEHEALTGGTGSHRGMRTGPRRTRLAAGTLVVVKTQREVILHHARGVEIASVRRRDHVTAVDPTGAGDAVAAGILAAIGQRRSVVEGCELGLRIASLRVSDYGDRGHADLRRTLGHLWPHDAAARTSGSRARR